MKDTYVNWEGMGQDIDMDLHCVCGKTFKMFVPFVPYECSDCHRLYEARVDVVSMNKEDMEDNFVLMGQ